MKRLLFILLLVGAISAISVSNELRYYVEEGETSNYANVTYLGNTYYIVEINGNYSFILMSQPKEFVPVLDENIAKGVISTYLAQNFDVISLNESRVEKIEQYFNTTNETAGKCAEALDLFFTFSGPGTPYFFIITIHSPDYLDLIAPVEVLESTYKDLNSSTHTLSSAVPKIKEGYEKKDVQELYDACKKTRESAATIKNLYSKISPAYAAVSAPEKGFPNSFRYSCASSPELTNALDSLIALTSLSENYDISQIAKKMADEAKKRSTKATINKIADERRLNLRNLENKITSIQNSLSDIDNLHADALGAKLNSTQLSVSQIYSASTVESANTLAASSDQKIDELKNAISLYESVVSSYKKAFDECSNAKSSIDSKSSEFGSSDKRVILLSKQLNSLFSQIHLKENAIEAGNITPSTKLEFDVIASNATVIKQTADSLQPIENSIDPVLIAAVAIIIIAIVLLVLYFKKFKYSFGKFNLDITKVLRRSSNSSNSSKEEEYPVPRKEAPPSKPMLPPPPKKDLERPASPYKKPGSSFFKDFE